MPESLDVVMDRFKRRMEEKKDEPVRVPPPPGSPPMKFNLTDPKVKVVLKQCVEVLDEMLATMNPKDPLAVALGLVLGFTEERVR